MTPDPTPSTRCGGCCCCGIRSPKKSRNRGSSIKGNCCAGRDRSVDLMVTTAGETRLTKSAYELCKPTGAKAGGCEGCAGAKLIPRLCPLHAVTEKATSTRLKRMFTREIAPLKLPILFIASLFLECFILRIFIFMTSGGRLRPLRLTAGEISNKHLELFQRLVRPQVRSLDSVNAFSVYHVLYSAGQKSSKSLDLLYKYECRPSLDFVVESRTSPVCPTNTRP